MKNFLKLITVVLVIGFLSSCNKQEDKLVKSETQKSSFKSLINKELSVYANDEYVNVENVRKALMSFDQSLSLAQETQLNDTFEIGNVFINKAKENGLEVRTGLNESFSAKIPEVPTELLKFLGEFAETANADSLDAYIQNLDAFQVKVRNSDLKAIEKIAILGSIITVKIIAKIVKAFTPKNTELANKKWVKGLKCAFKSLTAGLSGSLSGCAEGASIVGGVGALGGSQGKAIGSLVGCVVGGVIQGIINIVETAKSCS